MISEIIVEALTITCNYMYQNYSDKNYKILFNEILTIAGIDEGTKNETSESVQTALFQYFINSREM